MRTSAHVLKFKGRAVPGAIIGSVPSWAPATDLAGRSGSGSLGATLPDLVVDTGCSFSPRSGESVPWDGSVVGDALAARGDGVD